MYKKLMMQLASPKRWSRIETKNKREFIYAVDSVMHLYDIGLISFAAALSIMHDALKTYGPLDELMKILNRSVKRKEL